MVNVKNQLQWTYKMDRGLEDLEIGIMVMLAEVISSTTMHTYPYPYTSS